MANLTAYEKETVIVFNEEDDVAVIETANIAWKRRLAELAEKRPGEVIFKKSNPPFETYEVQKKWLSLKPTRVLSEKQHEANVRKAVLAQERRLAQKKSRGGE